MVSRRESALASYSAGIGVTGLMSFSKSMTLRYPSPLTTYSSLEKAFSAAVYAAFAPVYSRGKFFWALMKYADYINAARFFRLWAM